MKLDVTIQNINDMQNICGTNNQNIKTIENIYNTKISLIGNEIFIEPDDSRYQIETLFSHLLLICQNNYQITERDIAYIDSLIKKGHAHELEELFSKKDIVCKKFSGALIVPKTLNQKLYVYNLKKKAITFGVGPAGTGKTYLAIAYAANLLKKEEIKKLVLTRPAVEAGESLGYLPGDLKEKIDPYLRPLYDALYDTLGVEATKSLIEREIIEIAPLAYMRGRTLENSIVILDEAQNTTRRQMKMFLTRLGENSKMIITGDISQIDLPKGSASGLKEAIKILKNIDQIGITIFDNNDVVRHPLVSLILARYDQWEEKNND